MNEEGILLNFRDLSNQGITDLLIIVDRELKEGARTSLVKAGKSLAAEAWDRSLLEYKQTQEEESV